MFYLYDSLIHVCMGKTSMSHLKSPCFCCSLFGSNLSEILHSLLGWKNTWLNILMHITSFWSSIIEHGILTYVIGADLIGHLKHVCTWQMVVYSLGGISTFMISWWGTSLMYIIIMLLYTLMIYIMHSWYLEECIQENGIQEFSFQMYGLESTLNCWSAMQSMGPWDSF